MLFLASSMSHVEAAVVQVAYRNAKYLWPGFAGTKYFFKKEKRKKKTPAVRWRIQIYTGIIQLQYSSYKLVWIGRCFLPGSVGFFFFCEL